MSNFDSSQQLSSPYILIGNYGNASVAALQWLLEAKQAPIYFLSVNTGWQAYHWLQRMKVVQNYAKQHEVVCVHLSAEQSFAQLVEEKKEFPSAKYQWCAGMLKGLTINAWLDAYDPACAATIVMGRQRLTRRDKNLPEFVSESEHYNDRRIWYPLYQHTIEQRDVLIERAGFEVLTHRSLECDPCIYSQWQDFQRMDKGDVEKTAQLEAQITRVMFNTTSSPNTQGIRALVNAAKNLTIKPNDFNEPFSMGCSSPWGCGE